MIAIWLWFLAAFGFSFVVGHSKISLVMRELLAGIPEASEVPPLGFPVKSDTAMVVTVNGGKPVVVHPAIPPLIPVVGPWLAALLECCACLSWWLGLVAGAAHLVSGFEGAAWYVSALVLAFATSATSLLLGKIVGLV